VKRHNGISSSPCVIPLRRRCPLKTSLLNQQKFLQNERISILGDMPIGLFKKRYDGLGNLSVNPAPKQKWREGYLGSSERWIQKPSISVENSTYEPLVENTSRIKDYGNEC